MRGLAKCVGLESCVPHRVLVMLAKASRSERSERQARAAGPTFASFTGFEVFLGSILDV